MNAPARLTRTAATAGAAMLLVSLLAGCSGGDDDRPSEPSTTVVTPNSEATISQDKAIEIARAEIAEAFPDYDLASRHANVLVRGENYEVSFPIIDRMVAAGEPHVVINRRTGQIVERFMTG